MRRFEYPWYRAFLFPVTIAIMMGIGLRSAFKFWRGQASWKDRTLPGVGEEPQGELGAQTASEPADQRS